MNEYLKFEILGSLFERWSCTICACLTPARCPSYGSDSLLTSARENPSTVSESPVSREHEIHGEEDPHASRNHSGCLEV